MAEGEFENDRFVRGIGVVLNFLVPALIAGVGAILLYFSSELRSLQRAQAETNVKLAGMPAVDMEQVRSALATELAQLDLVTIQQISDIVNYSSQNTEKYFDARLAEVEAELLLIKGVTLKIDKNMERSIRNEAQLSQLGPQANPAPPAFDARDILFSFSDQVSRVNFQFEALDDSLQNTRRTALATNNTIRTLDNELRDLTGRISTVEGQLENRLTDVKSELDGAQKDIERWRAGWKYRRSSCQSCVRTSCTRDGQQFFGYDLFRRSQYYPTRELYQRTGERRSSSNIVCLRHSVHYSEKPEFVERNCFKSG